MEKKLLKIASSIILMTAVSTGIMAAPIQGTYSPFKDQLTVHFAGFSSSDVYYASYADNNGVNILGPGFGTMDGAPVVTISSQNRVENGAPSMTLSYPSGSDYSDCLITFYDGPFLPALNYQSGKSPVCTNLNFSPIQKVGQNQYSMIVTYAH